MGAVSLGSNIAALQAGRSLAKTSADLSKTFEHLSSGLRITHAADDAAGLAISSQLNAKSRVFGQAIRNVNDGISYLSIAEGALRSGADITTRQKELATEAANGSFSIKQRQALQAESDALTAEFNRIIATTTFNGRNVFQVNPQTGELRIQAGFGTSGGIGLSIGSQIARSTGDGTFQTSRVVNGSPISFGYDIVAGDFDGDGKLDIAGYYGIQFGNGDGTFKASVAPPSIGYLGPLLSGDFNGDGRADIVESYWAQGDGLARVFLANGNGSFAVGQAVFFPQDGSGRFEAGDVNGDGRLDLVGYYYHNGSHQLVWFGNGNGSFRAAVSSSSNIQISHVIDVNGDGLADAVGTDGTKLAVALGDGKGHFGTAIRVTNNSSTDYAYGDFNRDGYLDFATTAYSSGALLSVYFGSSSGTFSPAATTRLNPLTYGFGDSFTVTSGDFNGDGITDLLAVSNEATYHYSIPLGGGYNVDNGAYILLGNGNGSFKSPISSSNLFTDVITGSVVTGDFNGDGAQDIYFENDYTVQGLVALGNRRFDPTVQYLTLTSQADARRSLDILDQQLNRITSELGSIGSFQSRLGAAVSTVTTTKLNYEAADSRIKDADIAAESATLTNKQILQQAAAAVLSQANQAPALALTLLR